MRKFCDGAAQETPITESAKSLIQSEMASLPEQYRFPIPTTVYEAVRTPTCPTGMHGRLAVFEVLEMSPKIERVVLKNPVESNLWEVARAEGMLTMREDAIQKVADKKIPFSEINNLSSLMLANDVQTDSELKPEAAAEATAV